MAKISLLPALNDPNGTELVPVVKDGKTMRASVAGLVAGAVAGTVDNLKVDAVAYIGRPGDAALVDGTPTGIGAIYWHDTVDDAGSVTAVDVFDRSAGTINLAVYRGPRNALVRVALTSFKTTGTRTSRRIALAEPMAVRAGDFLAIQPTDGALVVAEVQSGDAGYTYSAPYLPEAVALDAPTTNGQVQLRFVIAYRKQVVTAETFQASTAVKINGPRAVALSSDVNPRGYVAWTTAGKPTGHLVKWGNYTATLDAKAQRMEFPNFSLAQPYAFIGNSLTDSTDVINRWSQVLSARYGQLMISVARYSSDWRMVYRVGAKEIVLTLAGALPAAGTVAVSKINGAAIDGNNPAAFLTTGDPGVVSGMAMSGYLTRNGVTRRATVSAPNGASFAYVVTQAPGQTAITFDGPVTFVPDFALSVPGRICVIWLGNNYFFSGVANAYGDFTNPQMWVDLKLIVAFLQARGCRVLLIPLIPSANTAEGDNWLARGAGTPYTAMESANARTETMFPGLVARHADGRSFLKFLQDRNDGSPEALDDVAKGFTPRNLRRKPDGSYDLLHMYGDGAGDLAVADFVDSALQAQALPNLVTQTTDFIITAIGAEGQLPDTAIARVSRDTVAALADRTVNVPVLDNAIGFATIGRAAINDASANGANEGTYIFNRPLPENGRVVRARFRNGRNQPTMFSIGRYTKAGTTFTAVPKQTWQNVAVPAGPATFFFDLDVAAQTGEYLGISTPANSFAYASAASDSGGYYYGGAQKAASLDNPPFQNAVQMQIGFDFQYVVATPAKIAAMDASTAGAVAALAAAQPRLDAVPVVAASNIALRASLSSTATAGRPTGGLTSGAVSALPAARTYVYAAPSAVDALATTLRMITSANGGAIVKLRQFSLANGVLTQVGADYIPSIGSGVQDNIPINWPIAAGNYVGFYTNVPGVQYTAEASDSGGNYFVAGDQTSFALPAITGARLQFGIDLVTQVVTKERVAAAEANAAQALAQSNGNASFAAKAQGFIGETLVDPITIVSGTHPVAATSDAKGRAWFNSRKVASGGSFNSLRTWIRVAGSFNIWTIEAGVLTRKLTVVAAATGYKEWFAGTDFPAGIVLAPDSWVGIFPVGSGSVGSLISAASTAYSIVADAAVGTAVVPTATHPGFDIYIEVVVSAYPNSLAQRLAALTSTGNGGTAVAKRQIKATRTTAIEGDLGRMEYPFDNTGLNTFVAVRSVAQHYVAVAPIFAHAGASPVSLKGFKVAAMASPTDNLASLPWVSGSFAGAAAGQIPAKLAAAKGYGITFGDFVPLLALPRSDVAGGAPLVAIMTQATTVGSIMTQGNIEGTGFDMTNWVNHPDRPRYYRHMAGDHFTDPTTFTETINDSFTLCVGVAYMTVEGEVETVFAFGDSIPNGEGTAGITYQRASYVFEGVRYLNNAGGTGLDKVRYEYCGFGWSGMNTIGIRDQMLSAIEFGLIPRCATVPPGSLNDFGSAGGPIVVTEANIETMLRETGRGIRALSDAGVEIVHVTVPAQRSNIRNFGATDSKRRDLNTKVRARRTRGATVFDLATVIGGTINAAGQEDPDPANSADGSHPSDTGKAKGAPDMAKAISNARPARVGMIAP